MHRIWLVAASIAVFFNATSLMAGDGKGTAVICVPGLPKILNPLMSSDSNTITGAGYMFNRFARFGDDGKTLEPRLAESWSVSPDELTYTFNLRRGVKFHTTYYYKPKRDFNAKDVLFTFNRMRNKSHPFHKVNGGDYPGFKSMELDKIIRSIRKIDDYTVEFQLNYKHAPFIVDLSRPNFPIMSKEYADFLVSKGREADFDWKPIGTGAYKLRRYKKDEALRLDAHEGFFANKVKVAKMILMGVPDGTVRFQKLRTGECHVASQPNPTDVPGIEKNDSLVLERRTGANVGYIGMNVTKKPFDNRMVRRAINYALNRESYIKGVYLGNAITASFPLEPTSWAASKEKDPYPYNPKKAKELLAKAGFPNGFETELWTQPMDRPYIMNGRRLGEMVQSDLAKVGVKVKLVSFEWATYLEKVRKGEHKMAMLGWMNSTSDPDYLLSNTLSCEALTRYNIAKWCDQEFNELLKKARTTANQAKRAQFYSLAQKIFVREAPWIPIAHGQYFWGVSKKLKGTKYTAFGSAYYDEISLQ